MLRRPVSIFLRSREHYRRVFVAQVRLNYDDSQDDVSRRSNENIDEADFDSSGMKTNSEVDTDEIEIMSGKDTGDSELSPWNPYVESGELEPRRDPRREESVSEDMPKPLYDHNPINTQLIFDINDGRFPNDTKPNPKMDELLGYDEYARSMYPPERLEIEKYYHNARDYPKNLRMPGHLPDTDSDSLNDMPSSYYLRLPRANRINASSIPFNREIELTEPMFGVEFTDSSEEHHPIQDSKIMKELERDSQGEETVHSDDNTATGMLPEDQERSVEYLKKEVIAMLGQETENSDSDASLNTLKRKVAEGNSVVHHTQMQEALKPQYENDFNTDSDHVNYDTDTPEANAQAAEPKQRKPPGSGRKRSDESYVPRSQRDSNVGEFSESQSESDDRPIRSVREPIQSDQSDESPTREFYKNYQESSGESEEQIIITKTVKKDSFDNKYKYAESMFWVEILQRGRTFAKEFGLDSDYCNTHRMSGLSFVEWFGFLDKYYSEAPELNERKHAHRVEDMGFAEDPTRDSRFRKPTGRHLSSLFPEFENALDNSKLREGIQLKRDPRTVAASLKTFISSVSAPNASTAQYANRMRQKPTGVQEDYLAKLLTRLSSSEMKQVIEKKMYEEKPTMPNTEEFGSDLVSRALAEVIQGQEYIVAPTFYLPPEYKVPSLGHEVALAMETDTENEDEPNFIKGEGNLVEDVLGQDVKPKFNRNKPPKGCRICQGMQLEPMNGPLLLNLMDDCGFVLPRRQTNFCGRHQRKIVKVLARSVSMGVIDWKHGIVRYLDPFASEVYPGEVAVPNELKKGGRFNK